MSKLNCFESMEHQILNNIERHITLSNLEKEKLLSSLVFKDLKSNELILRQGQVCKKIFFVESGCLRAFNISEEGKETTIMFAIKDWWITDMSSFAYQKEALLSIEAIQACQIVELNYHNLENLYKEVPKFERFFRILFQNAYVREQLRVLDNITYTTEERYARFLDKYPQIVEQVNQKQIASYLGVTPEFLSSIKKNKQT